MAATKLPKAAAVGSIGCAAGSEDGTITAADEWSSIVVVVAVVVGGGVVVVMGGGSTVTGIPDVGGVEVGRVGAGEYMVSDTRLLRRGRGRRW